MLYKGIPCNFTIETKRLQNGVRFVKSKGSIWLILHLLWLEHVCYFFTLGLGYIYKYNCLPNLHLYLYRFRGSFEDPIYKEEFASKFAGLIAIFGATDSAKKNIVSLIQLICYELFIFLIYKHHTWYK